MGARQQPVQCRLDALLVLHSGYDAAYRRGGECDDPNYRDRIHSQGHANSSGSAWQSHDGAVQLQGYAMASAYDWVCDPDRATTVGVPVHELIHTLGLAQDLYDGSTGALGGLASFDVMASPIGPARTGRPASTSSYIKQRLGWLNYTEIHRNGEYRLATANRYSENSAYVIREGFPVDEYILLEHRQAVDWDVDLFGGGLLIYHVDDSKRLQGVGGYPSLEGWPANGLHYRVALLQADGQYDLERGVNNGDAGDFWKPGMTLGPGRTNDRDGGAVVYPNTDSYQNGTIALTGISITVLEEQGAYVTIRVSGFMVNNNDGAAETLTPTVSPTVTPNDALSSMMPAPAISDVERASFVPTTATDAVSPEPHSTMRPTSEISVSPTDYAEKISNVSVAGQATTENWVPTLTPSATNQPTTAPSAASTGDVGPVATSPSLRPTSSQQPSDSQSPSASADPTFSVQPSISRQPQILSRPAPQARIGTNVPAAVSPSTARNNSVGDPSPSPPSSDTFVRTHWIATGVASACAGFLTAPALF